MNTESLTSPCGLACFLCPVYLSKNNDVLRKTLAEKMNLPEEEVHCAGCRQEKGQIPILKMTRPCHTFTCAREKKVTFCSDCAEFPCDRLMPRADKAASVPHNLKVYNLCQIQRLGLKEWAENRAAKNSQCYFHSEIKLS